MPTDTAKSTMHRRLVEALYVDTMVLADEARFYCEQQAPIDMGALDPVGGVLFGCESMRLTTRLMHLLAWLLNRRAVFAGETDAAHAERLVHVVETAPEVRLRLPQHARALIAVGEALHRRAAALDRAMAEAAPAISPARALQQRLKIDLRG